MMFTKKTPWADKPMEFFSKRDQHSIDILEDIFGEKDGIVFLIQHMETKLYVSGEIINKITFFIESEYTDDPEKAMRFKIKTNATSYCIERDILINHIVVNYMVNT